MLIRGYWGRVRAIAASPQSKPEPAVRPRILFLTCHLPWPAISGGRRRELELITRLSARFDVHVVAVSKTFEQDRGNVRGLAELCHRVEVFGVVPPVPRMAIGPQPAVVSRHHCSAATRRIAEL